MGTDSAEVRMSLVRDPSTGEAITEVAESGAAEVAAALEPGLPPGYRL